MTRVGSPATSSPSDRRSHGVRYPDTANGSGGARRRSVTPAPAWKGGVVSREAHAPAGQGIEEPRVRGSFQLPVQRPDEDEQQLDRDEHGRVDAKALALTARGALLA